MEVKANQGPKVQERCFLKQMSDAQHFAEDLCCCSVFSPSSENNQYHQVSS